jgi:NAD-dependent dihydropyrimidine dehydrogenase PreA subunit
MSVARNSVDACIGCGTCADICPMDVFYMDEEAQKSVIVYPENCQSCGQCYLNCPTDSLMMVINTYAFGINPTRGLRTFTEVIPTTESETSGSSAADASSSSEQESA